MGTVPDPSGGLAGNSNYFLWNATGNPITDLSVIIQISEDIVAPYGFSFQLNCYSPTGANCDWQQYVLALDPGTMHLYWQIDNWPSSSFRTTENIPSGGDLLNQSRTLITVPGSGGRLPAGYTLTIGLTNDGSGNIIGVTYLIVDNQGHSTSSGAISLTSFDVDGVKPPEPIGPSAIAPINAFQLNLVGKVNGEYTFLEGGAGTITYVATTPLTVDQKQPGDTTSQGVFTEEQANSTYQALDAGPQLRTVQTFAVNLATPAYKPGGPFAVSQQFGLNQTDLFAIDRAGQLVVFWADNGGHWSSSIPLGPFCMAQPGNFVAASQQIGANNQTDVFVIDQGGRLQVFWVEGSGGWNGPVQISGEKIAHAGAPLAVSQQFGANNQTDVFLFDKNGQLNVFWVQSAGSWNGPVLVGPQGVAPKYAHVVACQQFGGNQTDVFVIDDNGQINVYWVDGSGNWNGPEKLGGSGLAPKGGYLAAGQQIGATNQTDVFLIDNDGQLNVFWVQGLAGGWNGPVKVGPKGVAVAGAPLAVSQQFGVNQTDVFVFDKSGTLNVYWVDGAGKWNGPEKIGTAGIAPTSSQKSSGAFVAACQQFGAGNQTDAFVINETGTNSPGWPMVYWVQSTENWAGPKALVAEV